MSTTHQQVWLKSLERRRPSPGGQTHLAAWRDASAIRPEAGSTTRKGQRRAH